MLLITIAVQEVSEFSFIDLRENYLHVFFIHVQNSRQFVQKSIILLKYFKEDYGTIIYIIFNYTLHRCTRAPVEVRCLYVIEKCAIFLSVCVCVTTCVFVCVCVRVPVCVCVCVCV